MAKLPNPVLILAGFLTHLASSKIMYRAIGRHWFDSVICTREEIQWCLLLLVSAVVSSLAAIKSKDSKLSHGTAAFVVSFLLNFSGDNLGQLVIVCSQSNISRYKNQTYYYDIYIYCTLPIMILASLIIVIHFLIKTPSQAERNYLPDVEIVLLGVCLQFTIAKCVAIIIASSKNFCRWNGMGSWLELLAVSGFLTLLTFIKNANRPQYNLPRLLRTFVGSFSMNLSTGGVGWWAVSCAQSYDFVYTLQDLYYGYTVLYDYVTLVLNAVSALFLFLMFLKNSDLSQNSCPRGPRAQVFVVSHSHSNYDQNPQASYLPN